ncbi:MAG: type II toxin-antitoxin system Phd/YefM family antitoxin [Candidatus Dormibacteria bacterium]
MRHRVGIRELRQETSAIVRRVLSGETIEITKHGHPVARMVPLLPGTLEQLVLEGRATAATGDLLEAAQEMGLPLPRRGDLSPSEALAKLRADGR